MAKRIAAILARVSRPSQSLDSQISDLKRYASEHNYIVPDKFVFGEQISGINKGFKVSLNALLEALDDAKNNIQAVLIWEITRLNRDTFDFANELREITLRNVPVYFFDVDIWTWDFKTGKRDDENCSRLVAMSDYGRIEWKKITERTKRGRNAVAEQGLFVGHLSDGYIAIEDGRHKRIDIDQDRAKVIRRIFDLYLDGKSTDEIAHILNRENIPTTNKYRLQSAHFNYKKSYNNKGGIELERANSTWQGTQVSQIISNSWYKGERRYKGKIYPVKNIVRIDEWEEAQAIRYHRAEQFRTNRTSKKNFYLLANYFYCGNCGSKMYGHVTGADNHYYCSSSDAGEKCGLRGVNKENIEAIVWDVLKTRALIKKISGQSDITTDYFSLSNEAKTKLKKDIKTKQSEINDYNKRLQELRNKEHNIIRYLTTPSTQNNEIRREGFEAQLSQNEKEINRVEEEIIKLSSEIEVNKKRINTGTDVKNIVKEINELRDRNRIRQLIEHVMSSIEIRNVDKSISVLKITYINGNKDIFFYSYKLLRNRYLSLFTDNKVLALNHLTYQYGEDYFNIDDGFSLLLGENGEFGVFSNNETEKATNDTTAHLYSGKISVRDFITHIRRGELFLGSYDRSLMERDDERKTEQERRYKEWRKKYNSGLPSTLPTVVRDDNYDDYLSNRKHLYNRKYKIKKNKSLSDEQKEQEFAAIDEKLSLMKAKVKYLTREEAVKKYEEQKTKK